ncbi:Uncharacterised protein r2_g2961 [Pycnogonum litorale]
MIVDQNYFFQYITEDGARIHNEDAPKRKQISLGDKADIADITNELHRRRCAKNIAELKDYDFKMKNILLCENIDDADVRSIQKQLRIFFFDVPLINQSKFAEFHKRLIFISCFSKFQNCVM